MLGSTVKHKLFGEGVITEQSGNYITVSFSIGEKRFVIPDSFTSFLTTEDDSLLTYIQELRNEAEAVKTATTAGITNIDVSPQSTHIKKTEKKTERANIAFKCNYCDGGCSADCIGFKGVCSDELMHYNVEVEKHVWCSSDAPCKRYLEGKISREELLTSFSCYESNMLKEWKAGAGVVQNGVNKGKPMSLKKVQNNSLAVLTTRTPESKDSERFIFAVFLVDESYEGDGKDEGYVTNHSKWRIELTSSEAYKMLFWNYYYNANAPEKMVFGSGLHRYLTDMQAAQILKDIIAIKQDEKERKFAEEFFDHFCTVVGMKKENIQPPMGALKLK